MNISTSVKEQINFYVTELDRLLSYPGTNDLSLQARVDRVEDAVQKSNEVLVRASGELAARDAGQANLNQRFARGIFLDQPRNLAKNGDFAYFWGTATPPPEWVAVGSPTVYPTTMVLAGGDPIDAVGVHLESLVAGEGIQQNIVCVPDTEYSVSLWFQSASVTSYGLVRVYEYPSGTTSDLKLNVSVGIVDHAAGLHADALRFRTQADSTSFDVRLLVAGGAGQKQADYTHVMVVKGLSEYRYQKQTLDESYAPPMQCLPPRRRGKDGPRGRRGVPGLDGADGAAGATGATGADGATGATGADGATGPAGPPGLDGADGATGPPGPAGADGAAGATGSTGADGAAGTAGLPGMDGEDGAAGPPGATGPAGADGATGATGADGATGERGLPGLPGMDGDDGIMGMPRYEAATHSDTLAAAVARGSIIVGNATPKWSALAAGALNTFLRSDGTDPAWFDLFGTSNNWTAAQQILRLGIGVGAPAAHLLHVDAAAATGRIVFDADAGVARIFSFRTNDTARWAFRVDGAETGADAGADFSIRRYSDAGAYVATPLAIVRSTGIVTISQLALTTDLAVADGGTGASTAGGALTNFGLSPNGQSLVTAVDYAAMRALLDLEAGTDFLTPAAIAAAYQPLDTDLTAIAALVSAADKMPYATGAGTWALADLSAFARTILDDANAAAVRATIGAGTGDGTVTSVGATSPITSSGGATPTISTSMATGKLIGRSTAGTGVMEEITVGSGLSLAAGTLTSSGGSLDINGLTAADPALADEVPIYDASASANRKVTVQELGGYCCIGVSELRLTLTSGTAVTTSDVTAAGTLYLTPYIGNRIRIYDGTRWNQYQTAELSLALTLTSGMNYDVFVYDNSGTLTLETLVWTDDTTRATALTTQDGVVVKSGATTRLYLGTIRASAANVTEDSAAKRFVWNMYNRVPRAMRAAQETTDSWSYASGTIRQVNANAANQLMYVCGLARDAVAAQATLLMYASTDVGKTGIGVDSTTTFAAEQIMGLSVLGYGAPTASYHGIPGLGYHFLAWLEQGTATGTHTHFGDNSAGSLPTQCGIAGACMA